MSELKRFQVEAVVQGNQILLHCPGLEEAIALSSLLSTSNQTASTTITHAFGPSDERRVYDSDNYVGDPLFLDGLIPLDARKFIKSGLG